MKDKFDALDALLMFLEVPYNKFEKGIERQLNPPCSFPSVFWGKRPQTVSQTV